MPGQAIGTSMLYGYPGSFARNGDCVIRNRIVKTTAPAFGDPVVLNTDGTVTKFGAAGTAATFDGVAVREVMQNAAYLPAIGTYAVGQPCDVIQRGSVSVICNVGTPTAGGAVYIRVTANAGIPAGVVGGFEFRSDTDDDKCLLITNAKWTNGLIDANKVAELTILSRLNP